MRVSLLRTMKLFTVMSWMFDYHKDILNQIYEQYKKNHHYEQFMNNTKKIITTNNIIRVINKKEQQYL